MMASIMKYYNLNFMFFFFDIISFHFHDNTAWAWAGKGHSPNLVKPVKPATSLTDPKIIVSRSHAGSVKETALKSFGDKTEVIPAGGAGK